MTRGILKLTAGALVCATITVAGIALTMIGEAPEHDAVLLSSVATMDAGPREPAAAASLRGPLAL
jgi:hypothetical protein